MSWQTGWVKEVRGDGSGEIAATISCPPRLIPTPGRYLLAADDAAALPAALFNSEVLEEGFLASPPIPASWAPGTQLRLRGPLGHGFAIPEGVRRLALAALGSNAARLRPLVDLSIRRGISVAVFTDISLASLPALVEVNPLAAITEALSWADYITIDLPLESLLQLRAALGVPADKRLPCPGQALIVAPMPCGGMADCGVCALPARRGWKLLCKDGPVLELADLLSGLP